ncbi:MAG: AAA family ATPase [Propionibacteriaceae bacterium]|jgi:adenylate kinase family enzyme|nr:AAA family ATPase [Propionibacteriaceae bacterium]
MSGSPITAKDDEGVKAMRRVSVVGSSGSGKSTLARRLSSILGAPYTELDALFWGPEWTEASGDELGERVSRAIAGDAWIVDGNYRNQIGALVWERADTVVWVNPPKPVVMWRVLIRTVRRIVTREELWNGNRERWSSLMFWRGDDSILHWAWTSYAPLQQRYEAAMVDPANVHLAFHRLRSSRDVERFLDKLAHD